MTVNKPVPCSIDDIRGIQEWLDEMALQGLFLVEFNQRFDRAEFELDDPRPVRYRLDPMGRDKKKDKEREEPYAQMGWKFVAHIPKWYNIYSCDDRSAPELYSDHQSLSIAMEPLIRRQIRNNCILTLAAILVLCLPFLVSPLQTLENFILWTDPRSLFFFCLYLVSVLFCLPLLALDVRRLLRIRDTLAQGLPLKAKRRWNRPSFYAWWIPLYLCIFMLPRLLFPEVGWDICGLEDFTPSRPWPDIVQTEGAGPRPLEETLYPQGYATFNSSWFAPIQEFSSADWYVRLPSEDSPHLSGDYWTGVRYVRARSPAIAELIYRLERGKEVRYQREAPSYPNGNHITDLQPFRPWERPGVDRAELASYHRRGQDIWTVLLLRGNDVLMVEYSGLARPEDCIPLFLEALDKEAAP